MITVKNSFLSIRSSTNNFIQLPLILSKQSLYNNKKGYKDLIKSKVKIKVICTSVKQKKGKAQAKKEYFRRTRFKCSQNRLKELIYF